MGVVTKLAVFDERVSDVDTEAVDASLKPELKSLLELGTQSGVTPIEVGLFRQEQMAVVLSACFIEGPGWASEVCDPVVGRSAVGCWVTPQVVVAVGTGRVLNCSSEPPVLVAGVVRNDVEHNSQTEFVRAINQPLHCHQVAEDGLDVDIVGNVVAVICHGRRVARRDPDDVDAQPGEVVQALGDPGQIADSVSGAVSERADINLVTHGIVEPGQLLCFGGRFVRQRTTALATQARRP